MSELVATGIEITFIGMGAVFVLLALLVFVMQGMSKLAHLITGPPEQAAAVAASEDSRLTAAIAAAVHAYRAKHGLEVKAGEAGQR